MSNPLARLRYHVSGAIARGETQAIEAMPAQEARPDPLGYYARKAARESAIRAAAPYLIRSSGARFDSFDKLETYLRGIGLAVDPASGCPAGRFVIFDPASGSICDWLETGGQARHG